MEDTKEKLAVDLADLAKKATEIAETEEQARKDLENRLKQAQDRIVELEKVAAAAERPPDEIVDDVLDSLEDLDLMSPEKRARMSESLKSASGPILLLHRVLQRFGPPEPGEAVPQEKPASVAGRPEWDEDGFTDLLKQGTA